MLLEKQVGCGFNTRFRNLVPLPAEWAGFENLTKHFRGFFEICFLLLLSIRSFTLLHDNSSFELSHGFFELAILTSPFDAEIGNPLQCLSTRNSCCTQTSFFFAFLLLSWFELISVSYFTIGQKLASSCSQAEPKLVSIYTGYLLLVVSLITSIIHGQCINLLSLSFSHLLTTLATFGRVT